MSAKVYPLPTGAELMSGPIVSGGETRKEKEINFLMQNVENRLTSLKIDVTYETYKVITFFGGLLSAIFGIMLVCLGFHVTPLFNKYQNDNIAAIFFGCCFCVPIIYWFVFVFLPKDKEKAKRRKIHRDRRERRKPTLFNEMVDEAKKKATPPPRKIKVLAHVRKHDYPITCSTWKEFCELLENATGLPVERQLIRYQDEDLEINLAMKLDEPPYNLDNGYRLHIYNKGGFFTEDAPIKQQLKELNTQMLQLAIDQQRLLDAQNADVAPRFSFAIVKEALRPKGSYSDSRGGGSRPGSREGMGSREGSRDGPRGSKANNNNRSGDGFDKKSFNTSGKPKSSFKNDKKKSVNVNVSFG